MLLPFVSDNVAYVMFVLILYPAFCATALLILCICIYLESRYMLYHSFILEMLRFLRFLQ